MSVQLFDGIKQKLFEQIKKSSLSDRDISLWASFCEYATEEQANEILEMIMEDRSNLQKLTDELIRASRSS